jgi:hypothetical protein
MAFIHTYGTTRHAAPADAAAAAAAADDAMLHNCARITLMPNNSAAIARACIKRHAHPQTHSADMPGSAKSSHDTLVTANGYADQSTCRRQN